MTRSIILTQDDSTYIFGISEVSYMHMGVDDIYAIAVYSTGHIIYNLDYDMTLKEKEIILTT